MRQLFLGDDLRKKAIDVAGTESGKTAADIGAGTGFMTEILLEMGLDVISIDL